MKIFLSKVIAGIIALLIISSCGKDDITGKYFGNVVEEDIFEKEPGRDNRYYWIREKDKDNQEIKREWAYKISANTLLIDNNNKNIIGTWIVSDKCYNACLTDVIEFEISGQKKDGKLILKAQSYAAMRAKKEPAILTQINDNEYDLVFELQLPKYMENILYHKFWQEEDGKKIIKLKRLKTSDEITKIDEQLKEPDISKMSVKEIQKAVKKYEENRRALIMKRNSLVDIEEEEMKTIQNKFTDNLIKKTQSALKKAQNNNNKEEIKKQEELLESLTKEVFFH